MKCLLIVGLLTLFLCGCDGSNEYTATPDGGVPDYNVTNQQEVQQKSSTLINASIDSGATSEGGLRQIAQQFRSENADADGVIITFYAPLEEGNGAGARQSGTAAAANSEEAAADIFTRDFLAALLSESSREEIMQDQNGMLVVSIEDEVDSITQEVCAEETDPEMRTMMDCPGT